jgi:putative membrane protein
MSRRSAGTRACCGEHLGHGRRAAARCDARTRLANERTYLAWWRTGLTTLAVSFAAGRLVPELAGGARWPFELIGVAFALVGVVFIFYGYRRHSEVEAALARSDYASLPHRASALFAGLGVLLGFATILLVVLHPK